MDPNLIILIIFIVIAIFVFAAAVIWFTMLRKRNEHTPNEQTEENFLFNINVHNPTRDRMHPHASKIQSFHGVLAGHTYDKSGSE